MPPEIAMLAFDAETSGGLLISVAPEKRDALFAALIREGTTCAVDVGEVLPPDGDDVLVILGARG